MLLMIPFVLLGAFVFLSNPTGCLYRALFLGLVLVSFVTPFWPFVIGFLIIIYFIKQLFTKQKREVEL